MKWDPVYEVPSNKNQAHCSLSVSVLVTVRPDSLLLLQAKQAELWLSSLRAAAFQLSSQLTHLFWCGRVSLWNPVPTPSLLPVSHL